MDVTVTLDAQELGDRDASGQADAAEIVAHQIDQHHVFGALLGMGSKLTHQAGIFRGILGTSSGAGNRP